METSELELRYNDPSKYAGCELLLVELLYADCGKYGVWAQNTYQWTVVWEVHMEVHHGN